uniref:Uncharacterized protein n=1 Tax=Rhizophora mucronata TaxID=61149 RepID=A0A2P2NCS6_RHIMU
MKTSSEQLSDNTSPFIFGSLVIAVLFPCMIVVASVNCTSYMILFFFPFFAF